MKKIILSLLVLFMSTSSLLLSGSAFAATTNAPSFTRDFKNQLLTDPNGWNETVFNPNTFRISSSNSLQTNIYNLFSPTNNNSVIWQVIRIVMVGVLVLYFAWSGIDFLMHPNDEGKLKATRRSFLYLLFGTFLVYGVTWILGKALQIDVVQWSQGFLQNLVWRVLFQILSFLKAFAFFYAIVMTIWYGIQMMRALDKEDAIKSAKTWLINILAALVFIKVVDFVFFIAQDVAFASRAKQFMLSAARIIWYLLGALMVFTLIFAGFKYVSAQGDEAKVKDAKNSIMSIFYVVLIIFLFLLVAWQVIAEFA